MERFLQKIDRYLASLMFLASIVFLLLTGGALHLQEPENEPNGKTELQLQEDENEQIGKAGLYLLESENEQNESENDQIGKAALWCAGGMALLYPLFIADLLFHVLAKRSQFLWRLLYCLMPPLRISARDTLTGESIWLPVWGWTKIDRGLLRRMEKAFSGPMIVIALLMLPLLAIELFRYEWIRSNRLHWYFVNIGTSLIWSAFAFEFIVMVSLAEKKIRYCKEHWVDLAIICLPLLAGARLLRLGRLTRLNFLMRTSRIYRIRFLGKRMFRAVLVLDALQFFRDRDPWRRLGKLQNNLAEKEQEIKELREELLEIQNSLESDAKSKLS